MCVPIRLCLTGLGCCCSRRPGSLSGSPKKLCSCTHGHVGTAAINRARQGLLRTRGAEGLPRAASCVDRLVARSRAGTYAVALGALGMVIVPVEMV